MKIIGHRGAAELAPENTIKAIEAGIKAGADAVEFDIRRTHDDKFIVFHDITLERITGNKSRVNNLDLDDIRALHTFHGEPIPTLDEALKARGKTTALIEPKGSGWAEILAQSLEKHMPSLHVCVIAYNHQELGIFHRLLPDVPCYALERHNAFKAMNDARRLGFSGVDLNFWLLNPFTYLYARFLHLDVLIYTVNRQFFMRYFHWFYPKVGITTNRPDVLKKLTAKR